MRVLRVLPRASRDLAEACEHYEAISTKLASRFEAEIDAAFARILEYPLMYQIVHREIHRAVLHDFPYLVFYEVEQDAIVVHRVLLGLRDPEYWPR
ncbi:MAG TPA: type II toxin-antitoxin system RelE/ParE family toxin [Thermoanaerobaculia bacterium]